VDAEKGQALFGTHNFPQFEPGPSAESSSTATEKAKPAKEGSTTSPDVPNATNHSSASHTKTRRILLGGLMTLTYFLAVSHPFDK